MRGLVPRWGGGGGAWQNPRWQFAVPSHNSSFSFLRVPARAGISDCYESMSRTPIRDRRQITPPAASHWSLATSHRQSGPQFVDLPAKVSDSEGRGGGSL